MAPHQDMELTRERMKCFKRYFTNPEDRAKVNVEFARFSTKTGDFAEYDSISQRYTIDPVSWWATHGVYAPTIQSIAFKVLGQPSSSSCCERNWSTYSFINSIKRNKMTPQRAEDLVFIHSNLRLLSRRSPEYLKGETKLWDIAGDAFDSFEDVGMLEIANLSLDEPDLEVEVLDDDDAAGDKDEDVVEI